MKETLNNRGLVIISHTLTWLFIAFIMGLLWVSTWPRGVELPSHLFFRMGILFTLLVVAFYVNYSFLVERFLFQNRIWQYLFSAFLLLIGTILLFFLINNSILEPRFRMVNQFFSGENPSGRGMILSEDFSKNRPPGRVIISADSTIAMHRIYSTNQDSLYTGWVPPPRMSILFLLVRGYGMVSLSVLFVLAVGTSIKLSLHRLRAERQKENAKRERLNAELSFLKTQINPHFFFNMLNNIYSLVHSNPITARLAIHKLSRLMRYILYETSKETVLLKSEIEFIQNYIDLAKIRYTDTTTIRFDYTVTNTNVLVPPLLIIPFIENSFKHGIRQNQHSTIAVSLTHAHGKIRFVALNKMFENQKQVNGADGIGLSNVIRRLDLLYQDKYSLNITTDNGFFTVQLIIPAYEDKVHSD